MYNMTRKAVKRISPEEFSSQGEKLFFSFFFPPFLFIIPMDEMMDVGQIYCDNQFTIYVNQAIMLSALNLYSDVFLNNTGKKENFENLRDKVKWYC